MIRLPFNLSDLMKDKKQALTLTVLASLLILILYLYLILLPQVTRLTDVLSKTGRRMSELRVAGTLLGKKDQFTKTIASYKEKVDYYEKRLPAEQEIPTLLENLSSMAKNSNIKILGITPIPTSTKERLNQKDRIYQEIPILISAKSGYHELGAFLSNLESGDRFMKVVDLKVRSNRPTPKKHDVEMRVSTYILLRE